jgi:undecaprenyl diphosphate synthase
MSNSSQSVPNHVGIILDGNRRWATQRNVSVTEGHKQGFTTFRTIADAALERGVKFLSVYAFSTENWNRSKDEVSFLLSFVQIVLQKYIHDLNKKNIRFIWLGTEDGLDAKIVKQFRAAEIATKDNTAGTLCLCFNYGGQQEIIEAAERLRTQGTEINQATLQSALYGGDAVPPVDLLIRTSGEKRISNFMLWRAAYSELYFSDVLWPDFSVTNLDEALAEYATRQRRFGS